MKNRKREICTSGSVRDEDGQPPHLLGRRNFLHLAAGAAALPAISRAARAQAYPSRPVTLIVFVPAGSAPDITARLIGQSLSQRLGQSVVVDNRPGAGGNLALQAVARAQADGYTLLLVSTAHAINATLYEKSNVSVARDIAPVASMTDNSFVMVVSPSLPAKTLAEFIAYAKANPGKITNIERERKPKPSVRRAVQDDGRYRHDARALSGLSAGAHRTDGW
jgi:tripartite-type tricarboxylate transporter receptor subunit TctC